MAERGTRIGFSEMIQMFFSNKPISFILGEYDNYRVRSVLTVFSLQHRFLDAIMREYIDGNRRARDNLLRISGPIWFNQDSQKACERLIAKIANFIQRTASDGEWGNNEKENSLTFPYSRDIQALFLRSLYKGQHIYSSEGILLKRQFRYNVNNVESFVIGTF